MSNQHDEGNKQDKIKKRRHGEWTKEEMEEAEPLPMPEVDEDDDQDKEEKHRKDKQEK